MRGSVLCLALVGLLWSGTSRGNGIPAAPILTFSLDVEDAVGAEAAVVQAALVAQQRMTSCYVEGAAPAGQPQAQGQMVLRVQWVDGTAEVLSQRQDAGLERIADCLVRFIQQDSLPSLVGTTQATLAYRVHHGPREGASRPQGDPRWEGVSLPVAQVAVTIQDAAGVSTETVAALLDRVQPATVACYQDHLRGPGSISAGQVVVAAQWSRQFVAIDVSHSGGLDAVGNCLADVVQALLGPEAANTRRKASADVVFDLQARPGTM